MEEHYKQKRNQDRDPDSVYKDRCGPAQNAQYQACVASVLTHKAFDQTFSHPRTSTYSIVTQNHRRGNRFPDRQTHILLEEVTEATIEGTRKQYMESISSVALLIIDDFGMLSCRRPLPRIC